VTQTSTGATPFSELRRWALGADATEMLIHLALAQGAGQFIHPFAAAGNVCAQFNSVDGSRFLCGSATGSTWKDINAPQPGGFAGGRPFMLGTDIIAASHVIHLADLSVSARPGAAGAQQPLLNSKFVRTLDGQQAVMVGSWGMAQVKKDGTYVPLDSSVTWERIIDGGAYAWAYGGSRLQRFDLATAKLDPTNYLGQTGLLQVTDMSISTGGKIRIDGTGSSGLPVIVSIDTQTGAIAITTQDLPRLQSVLPLK
jgi:hypothetical protein